MENNYTDLFYGPVFSRRFKYSLGIDLIPYKNCSYDCIYCQLGRTTIKTVERKSFKNLNIVDFKKSLFEKIKREDTIDYLTFSGLGEPTLSTELKGLIKAAKEVSDIPVLVLTNGSLLFINEVFEDLKNADALKISLDAPNADVFKVINRPHESIEYEDTLKGLKNICEFFNGNIFIEIMLLKNINDSKENLFQFKNILNQLKSTNIKKIQINTPYRPSGVEEVYPPDEETLKEALRVLDFDSEIIKPADSKFKKEGDIFLRDKIIEICRRRPSTIKDLGSSTGASPNEIIKHVNILLNENKLKSKIYKEGRYYF